ncbi:MAG: oligosaccharide flippase family protein [Bryobacteraceae bacterium]
MPAEAIAETAEARAVEKEATHKFIRDVFFANLPVPFQKLQSYLWLVFFARTLGPAGFGTWSLFSVSLNIGVTIAALNLGTAMLRLLSGNKSAEEINQSVSGVFSLTAVSSAAAAIVIAACSNWGALAIFHNPHARVLVLLIALALPFDCFFEGAKGFLRARRLNRIWAFLTLARLIPETVLTLVVGCILLSVRAVVSTYLACGVIAAVSSIIFVRHYSRIRFVKPNWAVMSRFLGYGLPVMPGAVAYFMQISADRYIVSYYLDLKQVGIYSVCFTISVLTFFLVISINDVLFPELSALYDSGHMKQFVERFSGIQKFVFALSIGVAAILAAFPADVLRLFSSRAFLSGSSTLAILGIQGIFMAFVRLYIILFGVRLKVWRVSSFWVLSGAAILILDIVLIPKMGILGAAMSQLIATAASALVIIGLNWKLFRQSFQPVWLLQGGVAVAAVFAVRALWPQLQSLGGLQSILRLTAGLAVFTISMLATKYVRPGDLKLFQEAFLRRRAA